MKLNNQKYTTKITLNLEYDNLCFNVLIEPYSNLSIIKEKAMKLFYPLSAENIKYYCNSKPIIFNERNEKTIGDYFSNKPYVHIKIKNELKLPKILDSPHKKIKIQQSSRINHKYSNSMVNLLPSIVFPLNSDKRSYELPNKNNNKSNNSILNCGCGNNMPLQYFCRHCNVFLCISCKNNEIHLKHSFFKINLNKINDCISYYGDIIKADINYFFQIFKKFSIKYKKNNFIDNLSRKEIIHRKLDQIDEIHQEMIAKTVSAENLSVIAKEFYNKCEVLKKSIDKIINQLLSKVTTNNRGENNTNVIIEAYKEINKIEGEIRDLETTSIMFQRNYDVYQRIDEDYNMIEKVLDLILNKSQKGIGTLDENHKVNTSINTSIIDLNKLVKQESDYQKKQFNTSLFENESKLTIAIENEDLKKKESIQVNIFIKKDSEYELFKFNSFKNPVNNDEEEKEKNTEDIYEQLNTFNKVRADSSKKPSVKLNNNESLQKRNFDLLKNSNFK